MVDLLEKFASDYPAIITPDHRRALSDRFQPREQNITSENTHPHQMAIKLVSDMFPDFGDGFSKLFILFQKHQSRIFCII